MNHQRAIADALATLTQVYPADLLGKLLRTQPQAGSHTWDCLESPDPMGRARGVLCWLIDAAVVARRDAAAEEVTS